MSENKIDGFFFRNIADTIRPGVRGLDFVTTEELCKRTGVTPEAVLPFALCEMLCNALDKDDAIEINIDVQPDGAFDKLTVSDNGSKMLSRHEIKLILDFENKASSKRGFLRVSRGYLGNALKCIFGYSYALAESRGLQPPSMIIDSGGCQYELSLKPDRIRGLIGHQIIRTRGQKGLTAFTVRFPKDSSDASRLQELKNIVFATAMVNPVRKISFNLYGEQGTLGTSEENKAIRNETSVAWYTLKQFIELFEDFLRVDPETQLQDFISLFRGFHGRRVIREILQEVSTRNLDSESDANLQFLPKSPLKQLQETHLRRLFFIMKSKSKPVAKRSVASALGVVGEENFKKDKERNGWKRLRYIMLSGFNRTCPSYYNHIRSYGGCPDPDHVEYPYLVELAVFDRNDGDGLKVYQCFNFMASTQPVFSTIFDVKFRLGRIGINTASSVTVVAHLVCPVLPWLNYGKSSLGNVDVCGLIEKAFDKILPIPREPKEYHPPPPPRPLSWVPHGDLHDPEYEQRLKMFAEEIKAVDAQSSFHIRPRMRGWGYRLEQLSKIDKGEFSALARAINDCRKLKLLPMDIISPDPDTSRHFKGIHRAASPKTILETFRNEYKEMLASLPSGITDFYKGEKYYLMMVVEKGEILNVFSSVCKDYFTPFVSSKGWSNLEIRANIATQCKWAVDHGLIPVLLLFYDHDPKGLEIPSAFRKNLKDMEKATGWNPDNMIIERFGLSKEQIDKFELSWVNNLKTSSGREAKRTRKVLVYIQKYGERKCEMESLFKDDETLRAAEQICRDAIERYYGSDAKERFKNKEEESKGKLTTLYESLVWNQLDAELTRIEQALAEQEPKTEVTPISVEAEEIEVVIDDKKYGRCPKCGTQFNDLETEFGKLYRCRNCNRPLRLRKKTDSSQAGFQ